MTGSVDVQAGVDRLAAHLSHPVLIEDPRHLPLWWSAQGDVDGTRLRSILQRTVEPAAAALVARMRLADAQGPVRTPAVPEADMLARWCVPLRSGRMLLGYLWVLDGEGTVTEAQLPELIACAEQAAAVLAATSPDERPRGQQRAELLARLQSGVDAASARELISLEGLAKDATVAVQIPPGTHGWRLAEAMSAHVQFAAGEGFTSGRPVPLADLAVAVQRAVMTRRAMQAGARLAAPTWDALGSWKLVAAAPAELSVADVHPGAEVLASLPRTDLMTTARVVLDLGGDVTRAAVDLHIHRTTLYYRLERIEALIGVNLRTGAGREDLLMALRLAAYRAAGD